MYPRRPRFSSERRQGNFGQVRQQFGEVRLLPGVGVRGVVGVLGQGREGRGDEDRTGPVLEVVTPDFEKVVAVAAFLSGLDRQGVDDRAAGPIRERVRPGPGSWSPPSGTVIRS